MMRIAPIGEACGFCHLRFGSHELAKVDRGRYFHESTFKRCWTKFRLRALQARADQRQTA